MIFFSDLDTSRQVQGINYLKKAAEQGHEMALELLGACFRTKRGINGSNENEIKTFLNLSPGQRLARHAAHELFNSLCNGNEYVTVEQLEKRMREIYKIQKKKKKPDVKYPSENGEVSVQHDAEDLDEASSSKNSTPMRVRRSELDEDDNRISEAILLNAANNYSNGVIPALNQALTLSIPHPQTLENVPFLHRPFFHPTMFFSLLYHRFVEMLSSFSMETFKKYQIFIALIIYALVSTKNPMVSIPTFGYCITLIIMVVSSFKMLKSKHEFIDFRIWSGLFLSYNENVYAADSENMYLRKNLRPYVWFYMAFALNLMIYPLIADQWLPNSEITVLSFLLTFVTMICFMSTSSRFPDLTILFSFALNVLAKYPYEMDSVVSSKWRFLDLKIPGLPSFVIGSGIEFSMNCRGMLYIAILLFILILARRRNWKGIYQFVFPHCVTLAWLQITIISSQSATAFGLVRSALGFAGIFFFLPIFGLVTLLIPVFAAVEILSVAHTTNKLFITISTSVIAILGSCVMAISNRTGKYVTYVHILTCILASVFLFRPYMMSNDNLYTSYLQEASSKVSKAMSSSTPEIEETEMLNFDVFYKYCLSPLPAAFSNRIKMQMRCSHLDETHVNWEGTVNDVEISKVRNWRRDLLRSYAPEFVDNFVTCYFGEISQANCYDGENCEIKEFMEGNKKRCNLDKWNM